MNFLSNEMSQDQGGVLPVYLLSNNHAVAVVYESGSALHVGTAANQVVAQHSSAQAISLRSNNPEEYSPDVFYEPEEHEGMAYNLSFGFNEPSYGIPVIVITGHRLPTYSNWAGADFTSAEFYAINGGGGGLIGSPSAPCANGMQRVDWGFIAASEGASQLTGKVPTDASGAVVGTSGVTIATGFDIGAHNVNDLSVLGLSSSLISKLAPYTGLKQNAAVAYLSSHPITITRPESDQIDSATHGETLTRLVNAYDTATFQTGAFYGLPARTQTAIADMAFQYHNLASATPIFWSQIVARDFSAAQDTLKHFHDEFATRRLREEDLIEGDRVESRLLRQNIC